VCNDGWMSNNIFETGTVMATVYRGAARIFRKIGITFEKINIFY
jgi:hypothetical protein